MEVQFLQRIFVLCGEFHEDFLNRADLGIATGLRNLHCGRRNLARFNEVIVRQPNNFAVIQHGEVVGSVLIDGDFGVGLVVGGIRQIEGLCPFNEQLCPVQRTIRLDFQRRHSSFHGTEITPWVFRLGRKAGPARESVRDLNVLHGRQINGMDLVFAGAQTSGHDVVRHVFREADKHKAVTRAAFL